MLHFSTNYANQLLENTLQASYQFVIYFSPVFSCHLLLFTLPSKFDYSSFSRYEISGIWVFYQSVYKLSPKNLFHQCNTQRIYRNIGPTHWQNSTWRFVLSTFYIL